MRASNSGEASMLNKTFKAFSLRLVAPVVASTILFSSLPSFAFGLSNNSMRSQQLMTQLTANKAYTREHYSIQMPGEILEETPEMLLSYNEATETVYLIVETPVASSEIESLNEQELNDQMMTAFQSAFSSEGEASGVITQSKALKYGKHPALEVIVEHKDGTTANYRMTLVGDRLFILGARTPKQLTLESQEFFNSFLLKSN
jgi:hypothetical protein